MVSEEDLKQMELLLQQAAHGTHVLFDNQSLKPYLANHKDEKDYFDADKMQRVQAVMTELLSRKTYHDKMAFLENLDKESYEALVRSYLHLVEHSAFENQQTRH